MDEVDIRKRRMPPRLGGGKRKNRDRRKDQRRAEAEIRQAAYDALTIEEKLAKAGAREAKKLREAL